MTHASSASAAMSAAVSRVRTVPRPVAPATGRTRRGAVAHAAGAPGSRYKSRGRPRILVAARANGGLAEVTAAKADQRLARFGDVGHSEDMRDKQDMIGRLDPRRDLALEGGKTAVRDQRAEAAPR